MAHKITFDTVRQIVLKFGDVEESTAYGSPALKVKGTWLVCIPSHRSAEPDSVAVRVSMERRAELLENAPEIYYAPEHYRNYPTVLVRLSKIRRDALEGLLRMAWDFTASSKRPAGPPVRRQAKKKAARPGSGPS